MHRIMDPRTFILGLVLLAMPGLAAAEDRQNIYRDLNLFSEVLQRIESDYVDEVEMRELIVGGIRGMLKTLDPHTQFLDTKQYRDLMVGTKGSFGGLGIVISIRDGILTVISPIEGTPAHRMGIQGGDQILYIEDESTKGFSSEDAVSRLRGPEGTQVAIKIRREGVDKLLPYTVTREIIKLKSVPFKFVQDGIGYVKVTQFSKRTSKELIAAIDSLEAVGVQGLVLDLRGNPGGLLDQAVEVSDIFLDRGQMVTYTKGRKKNTNNEFVDRRDSEYKTYPLVVLVNEGSASASEIVGGAVQDWDRGLVVGKTTFGKGSVQSVLPLSQDTGLKLTTAKYYTPSGRSIHRDESSIIKKSEDGEAVDASGEAREIFHTKIQNREVYGGGGIAPDIEISQRRVNELEEIAERNSLFFKYAVEFNAYHDGITTEWRPDDKVIEEFRKMFDTEKSDYTADEWEDARKYFESGIRREVFRKRFGDQAAYMAGIELDDQLQATFDLFQELKLNQNLQVVTDAYKAKHSVAKVDDDEAKAEGIAEGFVDRQFD